MVEGAFALPILGSPKFAIRLAPTSVEADIGSSVCLTCGHLDLRVTDLDRIRRASVAGERSGIRGGRRFSGKA